MKGSWAHERVLAPLAVALTPLYVKTGSRLAVLGCTVWTGASAQPPTAPADLIVVNADVRTGTVCQEFDFRRIRPPSIDFCADVIISQQAATGGNGPPRRRQDLVDPDRVETRPKLVAIGPVAIPL